MKILYLSLLSFLVIISCSNNNETQTLEREKDMYYNDDQHNSRNSLDWNGVYKGVLPCADCEGIETVITLLNDNTFSRTVKYIGRDDKTFFSKGKIEWSEDGSKITAITDDGESQIYFVGENILFHLDKEGKKVEGDLAEKYMLKKNRTDGRLEGKKWILTKLMGKETNINPGNRTPYIMFDPSVSSVSGNTSCNNLSGPYEINEGDRISFGMIRTTMMACPDMDIEKQILEVLSKVDNYNVSDSILKLNKARMASLAEFKVE